ncbi:MAG: alpha-L-rhamnosidase C-terminal domain-containing protein [Bacteroidota bacterium]|nr:alpha-L-rhamnosidase C-terminal domain-containing protein [Bacteroidota bacterium]
MNYLRTILLIFLFIPFFNIEKAEAQNKATWIWYPGDYEIWLGNQMQNKHTDRGVFSPPFWKEDSHYPLVNFAKNFNLTRSEEIDLRVEGIYYLKLDGAAFPSGTTHISVPAGKHNLSLKVFCLDRVPAIYVKGNTLVSDSSWQVISEDKPLIGESGKVSDKSGTVMLNAGSWNFNSPDLPPSKCNLSVIPLLAKGTKKSNNGILVDFGKETIGFVKFHNLKGSGNISLYYGESEEEALSTEKCELLDHLPVNQSATADYLTPDSRAFRYVNIQTNGNVQFDSVSMMYEYLPVTQRGQFRCSDEEINKIWDVAAYTLHLNTREFFIDGIKRDHWIWSGDAYQSYLMNYYLFFDSPTVRRTILALRGKDPITSHINTIMDYTFYWFLSIYNYYLYTGDKSFIKQVYPRMQSLMDFCLSRREKDGLLVGQPGDWLFIDWADGLSKQGEVSFEQLLFSRSLETMSLCADIAGYSENAAQYKQLSSDLRSKLFSYYWNENKQAFVHSRIDGIPTNNITRYSNMFAIFFGYLNKNQEQGVKMHVLLNDSIQKITTPYMRFYELEALCALGEQSYVLKEMKNYWGGMLKLGATSFWEEYNPSRKGTEHYAMYGRPFGKSLCHAWGASPIYLLGKYYLGVKPTSPGYQTYSVEPALGGLKWMDGTVPAPKGDIHVYCNTNQIKVKSDTGTGTLRFKSTIKPFCNNVQIKNTGNHQYEMTIEKDKEYTIKYKAEK